MHTACTAKAIHTQPVEDLFTCNIQEFSSDLAAFVNYRQRQWLPLAFITPNRPKVDAKTFVFHGDLLITECLSAAEGLVEQTL